MANKHTETPYELSRNKELINIIKKWETQGVTRLATMSDRFSPEETEANARFIVKACNNHDKLVETLNGILELCNGYTPLDKDFLRGAILARLSQIKDGE